jgi:L-fucose mutarotase
LIAMLRYRLTHPLILSALASAGHGSQVLIADGHYPFATASNPSAQLVFLNLAPGTVTVTDVLSAVLDAAVPEASAVMQPDEGPDPAIFGEFGSLLPAGMSLKRLARHDFYSAARGENVALVIATGDQRVYANILLTLGVAQA